MTELQKKQAEIGYSIDEALRMGAEGNDSGAMKILIREARRLEKMTPLERGPILNIHFERSLKTLL